MSKHQNGLFFDLSHEKAEEEDWTRSVASRLRGGNFGWIGWRGENTIPTRIRKLSVLPQPAVPIITFNDSLKVFMDKFSIWQQFVRYKGRTRLDADILQRRVSCATLWCKVFAQPLSDPTSSPATKRSTSAETAEPP
ncbi:uncharacterized protein LACBIDRAFT_335614 [Laccaria bicolor S238N-H82]|uniref:Predicted protein n=1 Tax=Laccaria bicolor (strain S238N-H82 / ATCC MYA-4686) TaxID=486041 RepID=B0E2U9_LACBS|nr:uncharacterized protein LACBIDRAFT_335614 [Laccaria bicolor S238N-H82]EDQ98830.1 predicted protein [Laccaria bicolor S238N-H82]|eukprot:XP_001890516.1 predicted protein [Laccaria bicolor S238N-H82]